VIGVVTLIAVDVEPSPVIVCEVAFSPNQDGILLKTSSAATFSPINPFGNATLGICLDQFIHIVYIRAPKSPYTN